MVMYAIIFLVHICLTQSRNIKKQTKDSNNENIPWGMHTLNNTPDILIIAEGAFDALSISAGEKLLGSRNYGRLFLQRTIKNSNFNMKQFPKVFLCFDNDDAGGNFTLSLAEILFTNKIPFVIGNLPAKFKDVSDFYAAKNSLSILINSAKDGLTAMRKNNRQTKIQRICYSVSRFVAKPRLRRLSMYC